MIFSRRTFIASSAAALAIPTATMAAQTTLTASNITAQVLPAGNPKTKLMGFNGSSPGPELRVKQRQEFSIRFENNLEEGSAVHWHGIRLDNGMDGVPNLTQPIVIPGESFDYHFRPPDAGTFWYHSHYLSYEQVERGLYGAIIVEETSPPDVDHDITAIIDDWRIQSDGQLSDDFGNRHDMGHEGRMGNFARAIFSQSQVRKGDRVRIRLINAATARIFPLRLAGLKGKIVALDGMPLTTPTNFEELVIAPAQRVDVIADVADTLQVIFATGRGDYLLGELSLNGVNSERKPSPIAPLPPANIQAPDLRTGKHLILEMQGGAMGARHAGSDIWAFNGISGLPPSPFASVKRGETVLITLKNPTAFPHGIHLHGNHFAELDTDGGIGPLRDTTLVDAGQSQTIACAFENPGRWLLHCHMLGHQAAGMKTWVEVT